MCRLFGICYGDGERELVSTEVIAASLFANLTKGGPHAFGWFVSDEAACWTQKHYGRADLPSATEAVLDFHDDGLDEESIRFFVGHTRYATTGSPRIMRNNHPITHGNIVGVHNGKVRNYKEILNITGREDPKTEVDSEAIFAAVNKWGPMKGLRKIQADMVEVHTDLRHLDTVWIGRSDNRPVTIGWTTRGNLIFASERAALDALFPLVRFDHFSTVTTNRLITIRKGDIVERRNFRPPVHPPKKKQKSSELSTDALDRLAIFRDMDRAQRRGRALYDLPASPDGEIEPFVSMEDLEDVRSLDF